MIKKIVVALIALVIVGCQSNMSTDYRTVNDKSYMYKVEKMASKSSSPNQIIWVNPPKKKVSNKDNE